MTKELTDVKKWYKLAVETAAKSKCIKRKVGAVIVADNQVISTGYNLNSDQQNECCEDINGQTLPTVVHAEVVAINSLISCTKEGTLPSKMVMYVTHQPCQQCLDALKQYDITYVVVEEFLKFDKGKLRYDLIPPVVLKYMAEVLTYGAKTYKPNNWKNVDDLNRYIGAAFRHLEAWREGEKFDKESRLPHLAHLITNIAFLIYLDEEENKHE